MVWFSVLGIFTTVSLFVFGFKVAEEVQVMNVKDWALSWSFSLSCTACFLIQIAASVLVSESKRLSCAETLEFNNKEIEDDILPVVMPDSKMDNYHEDKLATSDSDLLLSDVEVNMC